MPRRPSHCWPFGVVALALLLVAGCGDSADAPTTEAGPASGATATTPTATGGASATPFLPDLGIATVTVAVPAGPQTRRLVLTEGPSLVLQETDGTREELVYFEAGAATPAFPAWSPDGATIALIGRSFFASDPEADFGDDIYLVPASGGEPRLLRAHAAKGEQIFGLAWRPDSTRLLFGRIDVTLRNGIPTAIAGAAIVELDIASGAERTVIEGAYDPSLSADGTRIAYLELGELPTETAVVAANADGSDAIALVQSDRFETMRFPRISPDGSTVVLTAADRLQASSAPARNGASSETARGGVGGWLAALLGGFAPRRAEAHGIPTDLWLVDSRSGAITRLTAIGEDDPYPAWSPDGARVIFIGTNGRYEASVAGGALVRTGDGQFDGQLAVAPR